MIKEIISGGQTGADQGGLEAAEVIGLPTSGKMPKGFRTERGADPKMAERYNLEELASDEYPPRTRYNVLMAEGTVLFGRVSSPGTRTTRNICRENDKPYVVIEEFDDYHKKLFTDFLKLYDISILNVAGNRESKFPGIQKKVRDFLVATLSHKAKGEA